MFYFIKPKTILKFPKDHKITEFIKVKNSREFSKKSNEQFDQVLKLWTKTKKMANEKSWLVK